MSARACVVTGLGAVTGFGAGVAAFRDGLFAARTATRIQESDVGDGVRPHATAAAPDAQATAGLAQAAGLGTAARVTQLALLAAREAWQQAQFDDSLDHDRVGLIVGRSFAGHEIIGNVTRTLWERGPSAVSALQFVSSISNSVLGSLAMHFKLRGPSMLHFGGVPLGPAFEDLRLGRADAMLVGACDELSEYVRFWCERRGLAAHVTPGNGARPYDRDRDGFVPGDGAAFLVIEREDVARARGARVLARLEGYAIVSDRRGTSVAIERDDADIAASVLRALADSGRSRSEVAFVSGSASGVTGEAALDACEPRALGIGLEREIPLFSHKGAAGETWGVAGMLASIATILTLAGRTVPPTAGTATPQTTGAHIVTGAPESYDGSVGIALALDLLGQDSTYVFARAS